ncbi:MAG TPA: 7-cyano-7-deazaguanine synthase QueC [Acidimicrobiia bacterium]
MTSKALVVLSGGQDSTLCLHWALQQGFDSVEAVAFDYGQKHSVELEMARYQAEHYKVPLEVVELGPILKGTSPLVNPESELEQYEDGDLPGGLEKTFVPMRNQMFLTIAANRAYCIGARNLITGVCEADSGGYPDCRQGFITALEQAINLGTFTGEPGTVGPLKIHTPLMFLTKAESIKMAMNIKGAYAAWAYSHTAYDGAYPPVGHDHATELRKQGFEQAGVPDPLILRAACEGLMELPETPNYDVAREVVEKGPRGKKETWTSKEFVKLVAEAIGAK